MLLDHRPLKSLQVGEEITDYFVIRKTELRSKKEDGMPYLSLELGNANGRIRATVWEDAEQRSREYPVGARVKVRGKVVQYRGRPALQVEKIRPVREDEALETADLLPPPRRPLEEIKEEFFGLIGSVAEPNLLALLQTVFSEEFWQRFSVSPAGKLWHHNRIGGLAEHTLGVAKICDFLAGRYAAVQRDLLVTGALLHDIGKVVAYQSEQGFIDFTDEGRLLGHLSIGASMVERAMRSLPNFPRELFNQVLHLVLSHHGELEKGASVVPMTLEALILYLADELDSKIDAYLRIAESERTPERRWSQYVRLLDRFFYFPPGLNLDRGDS